MRWEDERYVRLYTRDTATWKLLPWQSKALLPLVLRKLDRAGMADIGEDDWGVALAALLDVPVDFIDAGMPELLRRGIFTMRDGTIAMPKYVPAQEARQSAAQRKREQRFRENLRVESHEVTTGHTKSQPVTPSLAEPSLAEPSLAEPSLAEPSLDPDMHRSPPGDPPGVQEVFDHWLDGWRRVKNSGNAPKLNDTRRTKIRARLKDGYTVDQIKQAVDALWASDFHVQGGHYDIELVCRNQVKLDSFLARAESHPSEADAPHFDDYIPDAVSALLDGVGT